MSTNQSSQVLSASQLARKQTAGAGITEYALLIMLFTGLTLVVLGRVGSATKNSLQLSANALAGTSTTVSEEASTGEVVDSSGSGGGVGSSGDSGSGKSGGGK